MQRCMLLLALAAICIAASGCAVGRPHGAHGSMMRGRAPVMPPAGFVGPAHKAPLTVVFVEVPVMEQRGSDSSFCLRIPFTRLDFAFGDVLLDAAARKGSLSEVSYADYRNLRGLGVFGVFTVTAYGH